MPGGTLPLVPTPRRGPSHRMRARRLRPGGEGDVTQLGDEPGAREHADGPRLGRVDHERAPRLATDDEADDAVVTGGRALHDAVVAVDRARPGHRVSPVSVPAALTAT